MPKTGMEPIRRAALIEATIAEIGAAGSLDITVSQIAKRAGVSSGLAHHYFGGKDDILLAAMRHVLTVYAQEIRIRLAEAVTPGERLAAVIEGNFAPSNFHRDTISAWINFYVLAQSSEAAARLLKIYHRRLRSNLVHDLRPTLGTRAKGAAERIGALIDGLYLRHGLNPKGPDPRAAMDHVIAALNAEMGRVQ